MRGHKFKLDTVLDFRTQVEGMLKKEYSAIRSKITEEEEHLSELNDYYKNETGTVLRRGEITPGELQIYKDYLSRIRGRIDEIKREIASYRTQAEEKRSELIAAAMDKQVMETLKKHDFKKYKKEENTREIKTIDEHNMQRYKKR